jgi:ABC-type transport system involved in multi-copper enzyme maturation permease subunit
MMSRLLASLRRWSRLVALALRSVAGRRFWIWPLLPGIFPLVIAFFAGLNNAAVIETQVIRFPLGIPVAILAIALGVRVIGAEVDARTLEIAYTVPGGAHRVWLARLVASAILILAAELFAALLVYVFLTGFSPSLLYTVFQGAIFHLVLAAWLGALLRGTITAAMISAPLLALSVIMGGWLPPVSRFSPLFNHVVWVGGSIDPSVVLASLVQNRIGYVLAICAVTLLAFGRAERREKMLSG